MNVRRATPIAITLPAVAARGVDDSTGTTAQSATTAATVFVTPAEHDGYVAALGAVIGSTDVRLADIETRDAADLPSILWEPDEAIEAIDAIDATCP